MDIVQSVVHEYNAMLMHDVMPTRPLKCSNIAYLQERRKRGRRRRERKREAWNKKVT